MSTSPSPAAETPPSTDSPPPSINETLPPPITDTPPPASSIPSTPPPETNANPPPESSPPPLTPPPPDDAPPPPEPSTPPLSSSQPPEPDTPPQNSSPPPEPDTPPQNSSPPPEPDAPPQNSSPPPEPDAPPQNFSPPPGTDSPPQNSSPPPEPASPPQSLTPPPEPASPPQSSLPPLQPSIPPQNSQPPTQPQPQPPPQEPTPSSPPETSTPPLRPPPSDPPETPPSTVRPPPAEPPENSPPTVRPPPSNPPEASPPPPQQPPPSSPPGRSPSPPRQNPPPPQRDPPKESPPLPPPNPPAESAPPPSQDAVPPASSPPKGSPSPPKSVSPPRSPPSSIPSESPPPPRSGEPRPIPPRGSPTPIVQLAPPPPLAGTPPTIDPGVNSSVPSAPETTSPSSNGGIGTGATAAIGVVAGVLALGIFGLVLWVVFSRRKRKDVTNGGYMMPPSGPSQSSTTQSDSSNTKTQSSAPIVGSYSASSGLAYSSSEQGGLGNSRSWFTYEEMVKATNGFSAQNLLGVGGFGSVYKGFLPDGRVIAVKRLKDGGGQGEKEFQAEVEIISRIHHRHLVSLVGYCIFEIQRLLVYDFVPNNTLYFHLHGDSKTALDWAIRVKVAAGAARGIAYLHEDCEPRIIHRDIKSSNILLDYNFDARVSDFGLAKLYSDANTHITTRVMGTFGYMAPEYASSGKLTSKSDVFSFGVVLLELITGRKPVDSSQPLGDESLVEWARPLLTHALENQEFSGLVDPRLGNNYDESQMFTMIEAAAACVRHSAIKRPSMGQIVRAFDSLTSPDLSNGMRPGESEQYDSAQQSAEIRLFRRMAFGAQDYSTDFFSQESHKTKSEQP